MIDTVPANEVYRRELRREATPAAVAHFNHDLGTPSWAVSLIVAVPNILGDSSDRTTNSFEVEKPPPDSKAGDAVAARQRSAESAPAAASRIRRELLARRYVRSALSPEEDARLTIATERVANFFPSVTTEDYEGLAGIAERTANAEKVVAEIDDLLSRI